MFHFKTVILSNPDNKDVETAIRNFSSRRNTTLDFKSSASYISFEKYFLGFETDADLQITRI